MPASSQPECPLVASRPIARPPHRRRPQAAEPPLPARVRHGKGCSGGHRACTIATDERAAGPIALRLKSAPGIYLSRYSAGREWSPSVRERAAPHTCRRGRARSGSSSTLSCLAARCHAPGE
eukprot:scaffold32260_cov70-Phaeocystis_antarctica.AAC.1